MIAKIPKPGKSFKGCVQYCVQKQDAVILDAIGIRLDQVAHITRDFNRQREMNPALGQAVGHIALSWSPLDAGKLTDTVMIRMAQQYLQQMKIDNTQVLLVKHQDKKHPHLHIIYNRVDNEGRTISDRFQHTRSARICKELTKVHGFYMAPGKGQVNRQQLKGADKVKYAIYDAIRTLSGKVSSMVELENSLRIKGIEMQYKYKSGSSEVQGISFAKGEYRFKGSEIDRSMSYTRLSQAIAKGTSLGETTSIRQGQGVNQQIQPGTKSPASQAPINHHVPSSHHRSSLLSALLEPDTSAQQSPLTVSPDDEAAKRRRRKKKGISR